MVAPARPVDAAVENPSTVPTVRPGSVPVTVVSVDVDAIRNAQSMSAPFCTARASMSQASPWWMSKLIVGAARMSVAPEIASSWIVDGAPP
jgi:hypothetical protein